MLGNKFATLCILPLAAVSGCMSLKSLELVPMRPLDENGMKQIFSKQN